MSSYELDRNVREQNLVRWVSEGGLADGGIGDE